MSNEQPIRVLIVDDHPVVRDGLRGLFAGDPGFEVVGEAENGREAVARTEVFHPDVVLMDLRMPELDGVEATREMVARGLEAKILIITTYDTETDVLPAIEAGDRIRFRLIDTSGGPEGESLPIAGPGFIQVPDISNVEVLYDIADPAGDDHGPGGYTYPEDGVFGAGSYDLTNFSVGLSGGDTAVFSFDIAAAIGNPWGSAVGYSVQTFDLYIDTDPGAGTGARLLLPGRNAALETGNGWEYALTLEGWAPALYVAEPDGATEETQPTFKVIADSDGRITARIPLELLGDGDPTAWGFAVALMSQEGYPSPGVRRVRDINQVGEQWKGGGAPDDANHSRIYDVLYPDAGVQEELLSTYVSSGTLEGLDPDAYPQVPLVLPE